MATHRYRYLYNIGQRVYLRQIADNRPGFVTGHILQGPDRTLLYQVSWGNEDSAHYELELDDVYNFGVEAEEPTEG